MLGLATVHGPMGGTFTVWDDGVAAGADNPDLSVWSTAYREGLTEGLFLDRSGFVDVSVRGVKAASER
jgi:hypothetical protein